MAVSSVLQTTVVEGMVILLLEQITTTKQKCSMQPDLQPCMIVLIHENSLPPMSWKLAIVSETFPLQMDM
jgi:hypothetical protein